MEEYLPKLVNTEIAERTRAISALVRTWSKVLPNLQGQHQPLLPARVQRAADANDAILAPAMSGEVTPTVRGAVRRAAASLLRTSVGLRNRACHEHPPPEHCTQLTPAQSY